MRTSLSAAVLGATLWAAPALAQVQQTARGVTLDFVETDARAVIQALAPYLDRPLVFGELGGARISLQSARPEPPASVLGLLRAALATHSLDLVEDGATYVVRQRSAAPPPPPYAQAGIAQGSGGSELSVIRLRHARAADVAANVNALYGRASALAEIGVERPSTLGGELRDNRNAAYAEPGVAAQASFARSGRFQGEVAIVPDARTNSLLIRANRADFELIQAAVNQVDLRPLQVVIQVTIAEVRRESEFSYALSALVGAQPMRGSHNTRVGGSTVAPDENIRSDLLIHAHGIGGVDLDLTLQAGVRHGTVSILSRPIVFAANNERAEILVGDQRPFVQLRRSGENNTVDQIVQYKDVGTRLSVLPTISADGYVQLQVTQEVNNATTESGLLNAPVISTRTVQTSLLVRDGQTAVLGGLAQAQQTRSSSGIPFLSDLPIIGGVFGSRVRNGSNTELFVFLTPRVVRDDAEMDSTVEDVRRSGHGAGRLSRKNPLILPSPKRQRTPAAGSVPRTVPAAGARLGSDGSLP